MRPAFPAARSSRYLYVAAAAALLAGGCSGGSPLPPAAPSASNQGSGSPGAHHHRRVSSPPFVYVTNRTPQGTSQLLVYLGGVMSPSVSRKITQGLVDARGVAVDSDGNVYVANGNGHNVLEFAPGGTSLVETYSQGLVRPVDVTVAGTTLYVSDQGNASNGYGQQVFEYRIGTDKPTIAIAGLGSPPQLNEGIAVDPLGSAGQFFVAASTYKQLSANNQCSFGNSYIVGQNLSPTLWVYRQLTENVQVSGMAFDSQGNLYAADPCSNDVAIYSDVDYTWTYQGKVPGTFNKPFFLSVENQTLAVPSDAGASTGSPGYVTLIDLSGKKSALTVTDGLTTPMGAAVGPAG